MSVLILSCPCGLRMKAKGATPGRVGRCPKCGQTLTVPVANEPEAKPEAEVAVEVEVAAVPRGYGLNPTFRPTVAGSGEDRPARKGAKRRAAEPAKVADLLSRDVEPWWRPALLFPSRGAEGLMIVAMMGLAFWIAATLIPELCIAFIADAAYWGATFMGYLVSLIVGLPALALGLFAVAYTLQYLGRVLVSAAMGETVPPRPPDRNFDGLLNGLAPWLIWLTCGASVGLGPLACYLFSRSWDEPARLTIVVPLTIVGLPYAWMAMLMTFLHDGGFPRPIGVIGALIRFNLAFLGLCAVEVGLSLVGLAGFAGLLKLREVAYWVYIPLVLPWWMLALWSAIVGMRILGVFYHQHARTLRWHREKPWWAVTWGI